MNHRSNNELLKDFLAIGSSNGMPECERQYNRFLHGSTLDREFCTLLGSVAKTPLQEHWYLRILLRLGNEEDLLAVICGPNPGNALFILKKLPSDFLSSRRPTDVVNTILPNLSPIARVRLIRRISSKLSEEQAQEYLACLYQRYGIREALHVLPFCNPSVITATVTDWNLSLDFVLRNKILKQHPGFIEACRQLTVNRSVPLNLKYFLENADRYKEDTKIFNEFSFSCRGMRKSGKFIAKYKESILKTPSQFFFLNNKALKKYLSEDELFTLNVNLFKAGKSDTNLRPSTYPQYASVYKTAYNKDLTITASNIHTLKYMLPVDLREKFYEEHPEDQYLHLLRTETLMEIVKKTMQLKKAPKDRLDLLTALIASCRINGPEQLVPVIEYIMQKHRNEDTSTLLSVSRNFSMFSATKSHNERQFTVFNVSVDVLNAISNFLGFLLQKLDVEGQSSFGNLREVLAQVIAQKIILGAEREGEIQTFGNRIHSHLFKSILITEMEVFRRVLYMISPTTPSEMGTLLDSLIQYNNMQKKSELRIDIFKDFPHLIHNLSQSRIASQWLSLLCGYSTRRVTPDNELSRAFWKKTAGNIKDGCQNSYFRWLLYKNPNELASHSEELKLIGCRLGKKTIRRCKLLGSTPLSQRLDSLFENALKTLDVQRVIAALEWFSADGSFLERIKPYVPSTENTKYWEQLGNLTLQEDNQKLSNTIRLTQIQQRIPSLFHLYRTPGDTLNLLSAWFVDTFVKCAFGGYYAVLQRLAEREIDVASQKLMAYPVSVKKHRIHVAMRFLSIERACTVLVDVLATEKNSSIQLYAKIGLLGLFKKNPNDVTFELFSGQLRHGTTKEEFKSMDLQNFSSIHPKYRTQHLLTIWKVATSLDDATVTSLMSRIVNNQQSVSGDLAKEILSQYSPCFYKNSPLRSRLSSFSGFIRIYFNHSDAEERVKMLYEMFTDVLSKADEIVERSWILGKIQNAITNIYVMDFISPAPTPETEEWRAAKTLLFKALYEELERMELTEREKYSLTRYLKHVLVYQNYKDIRSFAADIALLFAETVAKYGPMVIQSHAAFLKDFIATNVLNILRERRTETALEILEELEKKEKQLAVMLLIEFIRSESNDNILRLFLPLCERYSSEDPAAGCMLFSVLMYFRRY